MGESLATVARGATLFGALLRRKGDFPACDPILGHPPESWFAAQFAGKSLPISRIALYSVPP
jgi:hypothetical protein